MEEDDSAHLVGRPAVPPGDPPPPDGAPPDSEKKSEDEFASLLTTRWQNGFFIGYATLLFNQQYAIFSDGLPNEVRRRLEAGQHSTLYSILRPVGTGSPFSVGVPYWFETDDIVVDHAPDQAPIHRITSDCQSIAVFRSDPKHPSPVIRCTLKATAGPGRHLSCFPIETHHLQFRVAPVFTVFKDQHLFSEGGDFLLKIHGGMGNFRTSSYLEPQGGVCATLSRDTTAKTITTDLPPHHFVSGVCAARKVNLALGCDDQPGIPTISNNDILLAGGIGPLTSRDLVLTFIFDILTAKYLEKGPTDELASAPLLKVRQRVRKMIEEGRLRKNRSTLLWATEGEGLSYKGARHLCIHLRGDDFSPELIAPCNGAMVWASNEDFFDVNPSIFPSNEFDHVDLIDGCVNVANSLPSGRISNVGSANVVRYAVGVAAKNITELWEAQTMFPRFGTIMVDGTTPNGILTDPDSGSDGGAPVHASMVVIAQGRASAALRGVLRSSGYVNSCEPLRSTISGGSRWSAFIAMPSTRESKLEELKKLLASRHIFYTSPGEYCRSSIAENGVAIIQCGSKLALKR